MYLKPRDCPISQPDHIGRIDTLGAEYRACLSLVLTSSVWSNSEDTLIYKLLLPNKELGLILISFHNHDKDKYKIPRA